MKKISYFFSCVDIANQLQKRHSPLAPLSLVDWWMAKHRREFICLFILFPIQSCLFLRLARTMAEKFVLHTDTDVEKFLANRRGLDVAFGVSRDGERESKTWRSATGQIDTFLSGFLLSVRKKSGIEYEATTRRGFITSVERHLTKNGDSLIMGQPFAITWDALKSKQKQLRRLSHGNKPREAASLDQNEIDLLFKKEVMGIHLPQALINILWFNNCLHFGIRGGKEQRNLS